MKNIWKFLAEEFNKNSNSSIYSPRSINSCKMAPFTTVEVERFFSCLNGVMSERRENYTVENFFRTMFVLWNSDI